MHGTWGGKNHQYPAHRCGAVKRPMSMLLVMLLKLRWKLLHADLVHLICFNLWPKKLSSISQEVLLHNDQLDIQLFMQLTETHKMKLSIPHSFMISTHIKFCWYKMLRLNTASFRILQCRWETNHEVQQVAWQQNMAFQTLTTLICHSAVNKSALRLGQPSDWTATPPAGHDHADSV